MHREASKARTAASAKRQAVPIGVPLPAPVVKAGELHVAPGGAGEIRGSARNAGWAEPVRGHQGC